MAQSTEAYSGPTVTRAQALADGLEWYFHGRPCRRGHLLQRRTNDQSCPECQRLMGRARYADNPEPARQKTRDKYAADPEAHRETSRQYRIEHPERAAETYAAWYAKPENMKRKSLYKKARHAANPAESARQTASWKLANPDANREIDARCYAKNPAPKKRNAQKRRVKKLAAEGSHTAAEIADLLHKQKGKCGYCLVKMTFGPPMRLTNMTEDHIVALTKGGSDWISNIILSCRSCNSQKGTMDHFAFAQRKGRLL